MKAIFISAFQAFYDEIITLLDQQEIRGFTYWPETHGRGSETGEPHLGSHAWPSLNCSFYIVVQEAQVQPLIDGLKALDKSAEQQGLRAFISDCQPAW